MPVSKLAANLRSLREANGYSQEYVSRQIHIARQTYSVYETGKRTPDLSTLLCLSALYNISLDQLVYGNPADKSSTEGVLRDHGAVAPDNSLIRLAEPMQRCSWIIKAFLLMRSGKYGNLYVSKNIFFHGKDKKRL